MQLKYKSMGQDVEITLDGIGMDRVVIANPPTSIQPGSWEDLTSEALDNPLDIKRIEENDLTNKKICIITDDWGRPTPAFKVIPYIVKRLEMAGARDENIIFVTASGMHDPMNEADLRRKLGDDIYNRFFCVSHDAGDKSGLSFIGITQFGTPVWVNKYVAEADFKIAVGRVYPHVCYGYEGGYKMITPGVSSFETILRDHSLNFSEDSIYGIVNGNPSRKEADEIGKLVGINFLLNFVVEKPNLPMKAFSGSVEEVFKKCVQFGEKEVWGTRLGKKFDVTIIMAGEVADRGLEENPMYYLGQAFHVTKENGTVIAFMDEEITKSRNVIEGIDIDTLSLGELLMLHEKRDWRCNERQIQHHVKKIRSVFYERRVMRLHKQNLHIIADTFSVNKLKKYNAQHFTSLRDSLKNVLDIHNKKDILIIPEGKKTFPLVEYSFPE